MFRVINSVWALTFILATVPIAFAEDPDLASKLDGTWKSDWALTRKHIDAECKLTQEESAGLERLIGKMTVCYSGNQAMVTMPEIRFTVDGKDRVLEGGHRRKI